MSLNVIGLLKCAMRGTSFGERGKSVSVEPEAGEIVLFFRSDSPDFRSCVGLTSVEKACDIMVFYYKSPKMVICFVELKGSEIEKAHEQIRETHRAFLNASGSGNTQGVEWKGLVITDSGSSARNRPKSNGEIKIVETKHGNIGDILRK